MRNNNTGKFKLYLCPDCQKKQGDKIQKELAEKGEIPYGYAYPELDNQDFNLSLKDKIDELKKEIELREDELVENYNKILHRNSPSKINKESREYERISESDFELVSLNAKLQAHEEAEKRFGEFLRRGIELRKELDYRFREMVTNYEPNVPLHIKFLIEEWVSYCKKIDSLSGFQEEK